MKIYLLKRRGRKGKTSLYLVYVKGNKRYYEFLKLYEYSKPKNAEERSHNKSIQRLARQIVSQKVIDSSYTEHGLVSPIRGKIGLLQFFDKVMNEKNGSLGNYGNYHSCFLHLKNFLKDGDISLDKIDEYFLQDFQKHLLTLRSKKGGIILNQNTASSYYIKLCCVLKDAYKGRYIIENPAKRIKCIPLKHTHRQYLEHEEILKLLTTECDLPEMALAFIIGCFTGLRFSDIKVLQWEQITYSESKGWQLCLKLQKTGSAEILPITNIAVDLLHKYFEHRQGKIFSKLSYSTSSNKKLKKWFKDAGITKTLTFHCSRHTFATTLLTKNIDIYTVSKLLGHSSIKTSEIYGKVVDMRKVNAVNQLSLLN